jgi:hypothetical protein
MVSATFHLKLKIKQRGRNATVEFGRNATVKERVSRLALDPLPYGRVLKSKIRQRGRNATVKERVSRLALDPLP